MGSRPQRRTPEQMSDSDMLNRSQPAPPPREQAQREMHASLRDVVRIYDNGVHALGPLDLDLGKGEFFAVVGPSGCGKSTLLDVLAGLSAPTSGTITFEGKPVAGSVPKGVG